MDARELNDRLCAVAQEVVFHLFPLAKIKNGEAVIGNVSGAAGESLKIVVQGSKVGHWSDFGTEHRGRTLTTLWCEARGKDCRKAFDEMHAFLNIPRIGQNSFYARPILRKAVKITDAKALQDGSQTMAYLTEERKLTLETLKKYRVAQGVNDDLILFPFFESDGKTLVHAKYLLLKRDENGKKVSWSTKETPAILFGKQAIPMNGGDLVVTEGEIDALSMAQMGYPAVSVPFGASNHEKWIENDYDWLECFSRIILCMDSDVAGMKAAREIAKRLGHHRCYLVKMPEGAKDANEVVVKSLEADLFEAMEAAATIDPPQLKAATEFWEETKEVQFPKRKEASGIPFLFAAPWNIRPKELTIWTGYNFHGKSQLLNMAVVYLRSMGQTACIASFEVEPPITLDIMTRQALGKHVFSDVEEYHAAFDWISDGMMIVNRVGIIPWRDLLEILKYAALRYRVKQFVIDSMLRCGISQDDFQSQKDLVDALTLFALEHECHVHLVAHAKKPQNSDESKPPTKYDIKGSGDISDLAHNVVCVHRDLEKQEKRERMKGMIDAETMRTPDGHFLIYKQRQGGRIAKIPLFHFGSCMQFQSTWDSEPICYVPRKPTLFFENPLRA